MGLLECPLKCGQCFSNSTTLKKHLESHLTNVKCPYCFLIIDNIHSLPSHLDDCIIKKEDEPDDSEQPDDLEDSEQQEGYLTEVISVLPDDDNYDTASIKQESQDKSDSIMVFGVNPNEELLDKEPSEPEKIKTSLETIEVKGLKASLVKMNNADLAKINDEALSDETESETETQEIEAQGEENDQDGVNIKFEEIDDGAEPTQENQETSQEYEMSPVVQEAEEQEIEAEVDDSTTEENVYHCSSCNDHFTDVKQHLAEFHTNQQVYLQVPEKEGKKVFVKKDGTSEPEYEEEMDLENLPSAANDNKDQAIWASWSGDYYLSTRDLQTSGFESSEDLSYVIRPKKKNACVEDLSPFYMEDQYGDKFFSVPVDTAIDYYEASNGRCGPKRFVGNFTRMYIGKVHKPKSKQRRNAYERIISTYQLSLTHILFSKMPPEHFLPIIVQINPRDGNDEGVKYKVCWKCNLCEREMDMWSDHDCEDVFTRDGVAHSYEGDSLSIKDEQFDESEDPTYINKENTGVETYVVSQGDGYKKIIKAKPTGKNNEIKKHMCKKCNIIFFKDSYFFEHVKEKHAIPIKRKQPEPWNKGETLVMGKYYCQPCKLMFASEKWLQMHHQTDHRHRPGYKLHPLPVNPPKEPVDDRAERTCYDCNSNGLLFESRAWYKFHRQSKHGEPGDPHELPPRPARKREKPIKPNQGSKARGTQLGVHVKYEPNVEPEEDEVVPDDGSPLEPKILRTCILCSKVKNSISNLRKHLGTVHGDANILRVEEEKESQDLIETLDGVMKEEIHEPAQDETEELYDIDENSAITRKKPARPCLYKFKQDGLELEDVQKRYHEFQVLEMDPFAIQCEICCEYGFETQPRLLKHMEVLHLKEISLESLYLIKKRRQREMLRRSKTVEILDLNSLSDEVRAKVSTVLEHHPGDEKEVEPVLIEIDLMGEQPGMESESAIEHLVGEETQEGEDATLNESTGPPPAKKCKFEIVKPDDLTPAVRKRIDDQAKALNIESPVYIRNLGTDFVEKEKQSLDKAQDRTSKVTVQILDYLNFREKLEERVNKRAQETQERLNKRNAALQEKELNKLEIKINSRETHRNNYRNVSKNKSSVMDFTGDTETSCMSCRVTFTTERRLERHKEVFHKNCSECSVCSLLTLSCF
ncbi:hypothetical protein WDU94_011254 [Cyamophila willieti]